MSLLLPTSARHRLTPKTRAVRAWTQVRYAGVPFAAIVTFWGVTVAGSGFIAGFIWAKAI